MDLRIKAFTPKNRMNNEDLKKIINSLIEKKSSFIQKTLTLLPKKDDENKQRDIKNIYEILLQSWRKIGRNNYRLRKFFLGYNK